jgi:hypothetical protein
MIPPWSTRKTISYYTVQMLTCSELLKFIARLGTACLLAWVLSGLSGCDQSNTSTVPSSSDGLASATPPSAEHTPLRKSLPATPTPPPDDRPRIVAFGDSLTAGLGVAPEQSYPTQLQKQLDALGYRYQVLNAGVSGDTSAGGLRRVSWVLAGKPQVVILELGGNDGLRGLGLPETRSHLDAIIRQLKDAHVRVILAGMKLPPNYGKSIPLDSKPCIGISRSCMSFRLSHFCWRESEEKEPSIKLTASTRREKGIESWSRTCSGACSPC